jgi:hypothetical protein
MHAGWQASMPLAPPQEALSPVQPDDRAVVEGVVRNRPTGSDPRSARITFSLYTDGDDYGHSGYMARLARINQQGD